MRTQKQTLQFSILAADIALLTIRDGELYARIIPVHRPPHFMNRIGLPGGLILPTETAEEAALRLIKTKATLDTKGVHLEQLYTFSALNRDPRGRVVAVAYLALIPWESLRPTETLDTKEAWWAPVRELRKLAYDHDLILETAIARLRSRVTYTTLIAKLMPKEFTLTELETAYESVVKKNIDKRNFRKKILKLGILKPLKRKRTGSAFRPAELYSFTSTTVSDIEVL